MPIPSMVTGLFVEEATQTTLLLGWNAVVDDTDPITGYEYRLNGGAWTATGTSATEVLLGSLNPGTAYNVEVRAVNALGEGAASAVLMASTLPAVVPSVPQHVTASAPGGTLVDLTWESPASDGGSAITRYEVCVIDEDGTVLPFESTGGTGLTWRVRGLAIGHRYRFRVRAVNSVGQGPQTPIVSAIPTMPLVRSIPPGQRLPLLDVDRQSLIVRLANQDCRVTVWWQPSEKAWYGTLEVPVNTAVVRSRRLALNAGLLDRVRGVLAGNLVCRDQGGEGLEPGRDAWRRPTHGVFWEPE